MPDKYTATWVSHSSIGDFLTCPRLYYLRNVYKDPTTRRKIDIVQPALSLGQVVHEVLESLLNIPAEQRFDLSLVEQYEDAWQDVAGKKGGFESEEEEVEYKERGRAMVERVERRPGPLANKAIRMNDDLPHYWLSEEEDIILCGKIDWLEHMPADDSVHVIDFKTGRTEVQTNSLQLPIYSLLLKHCQKRSVSRASYWYLERDDEPKEVTLPSLDDAYEQVIAVARQVKQAREVRDMRCPRGSGGCYACKPFEAICRGEGQLVGQGAYQKDLYVLPRPAPG